MSKSTKKKQQWEKVETDNYFESMEKHEGITYILARTKQLERDKGVVAIVANTTHEGKPAIVAIFPGYSSVKGSVVANNPELLPVLEAMPK